MPTGSQDDIQIKAAGAQNSQSTSQTAASTQASTTQTVAQPVASTAAPVQVAPAATESPAKPTNQRAFNLESDVDQASTTAAKPDKYAIPKMVQDKYPEMVELIKATESMDDEEREYWFQIMPVMTQEQIDKFKTILVTEKQQLADLDKEYEDELNKLNDKHLLEWKEFENKEKTKAIKEAESVDQAQQQQLEADLLAKLNDV